MVIQPTTPYEGGVFAVGFTIPDDYPFAPPACRFITPVYHPNIDEKGQICLSIFERESWNPVWTLESSKQKTKAPMHSNTNGMTAVLTALCSLLGNPNCDEDALRPAVVQEFLEDQYQFNSKARLFTQRFASRDYRIHPIKAYQSEPSPDPTSQSEPSPDPTSGIQQSTTLRPSNWLSNLRERSLTLVSWPDQFWPPRLSTYYLFACIMFWIISTLVE